MKKIVFISKSMDFGGVEKSLISLIKRIPENKYDVTILLMNKKGGFLNEIPKWIKIEEIPWISKKTSLKLRDTLKHYGFINGIKFIYNYIFSLKCKSIYKSFIHYAKLLPKLEVKYDLAISYFNPTSFPVIYTIDNIKAEKKVMWIHSDVNIYNDINEFKDYFMKYDYIYNASRTGVEKFIKKFPELKEKTEVFYNIIDEKKNKKTSLRGKCI